MHYDHSTKLIIACALGTIAVVDFAQAQSPDGYSLVWQDEFAQDGLPDAANWQYDTEANLTGWYNNELQYYASARRENSLIHGGVLHIGARKEILPDRQDYGGQKYTSARLITRDRQTWTYGFFEIRAKLPCGQGTWPAIWMLGSTGAWPASGEIDIMEQINDEATVHATIHTKASEGTYGTSSSIALDAVCSQFHRYQLTWTPDELAIGVDGRIYHRYLKEGRGREAWPFDSPQYILLNLAIGGDWPGDPDDTIFPVEMLIDYVRVYQTID